MDITEARITYKNGLIDKVAVLIQDGGRYKAYASTRKQMSGYYNLEDNKVINQSMIENTVDYGFKISAVHFFHEYFRK